jgi:hypothetical protein
MHRPNTTILGDVEYLSGYGTIAAFLAAVLVFLILTVRAAGVPLAFGALLAERLVTLLDRCLVHVPSRPRPARATATRLPATTTAAGS